MGHVFQVTALIGPCLNVNFKHSEIPDGYKYDGDNFLTWTNGVTTATRHYPILTKLIDGTAIRPTGADIRASYNKPRLIDELIAEKRAFSSSTNYIYYSTTHANYGTDSNAGSFAPEWLMDRYTKSDALAEFTAFIDVDKQRSHRRRPPQPGDPNGPFQSLPE